MVAWVSAFSSISRARRSLEGEVMGLEKRDIEFQAFVFFRMSALYPIFMR
jgi:hypothetical protein